MYNYILFDLDGTLTDPKEGITNSVAYALMSYGIKENPDKLTPFIGPPLHESFMVYYNFDEKKAMEAVDKYREYFADKGIFENKLYPETEGFLKTLRAAGKKLRWRRQNRKFLQEGYLSIFILTAILMSLLEATWMAAGQKRLKLSPKFLRAFRRQKEGFPQNQKL